MAVLLCNEKSVFKYGGAAGLLRLLPADEDSILRDGLHLEIGGLSNADGRSVRSVNHTILLYARLVEI